jgi:hypothetical protein
VLVLLASTAFLVGSVIGDLKHSLFSAILTLLSYVASILIVRAKSHELADDFPQRVLYMFLGATLGGGG